MCGGPQKGLLVLESRLLKTFNTLCWVCHWGWLQQHYIRWQHQGTMNRQLQSSRHHYIFPPTWCVLFLLFTLDMLLCRVMLSTVFNKNETFLGPALFWSKCFCRTNCLNILPVFHIKSLLLPVEGFVFLFVPNCKNRFLGHKVNCLDKGPSCSRSFTMAL